MQLYNYCHIRKDWFMPRKDKIYVIRNKKGQFARTIDQNKWVVGAGKRFWIDDPEYSCSFTKEQVKKIILKKGETIFDLSPYINIVYKAYMEYSKRIGSPNIPRILKYELFNNKPCTKGQVGRATAHEAIKAMYDCMEKQHKKERIELKAVKKLMKKHKKS